MKLSHALVILLWPLDVLAGAVLLLVAPRLKFTQTFCYGAWRD